MFYACRKNQVDTVKLLLEYGAEVYVNNIIIKVHAIIITMSAHGMIVL